MLSPRSITALVLSCALASTAGAQNAPTAAAASSAATADDAAVRAAVDHYLQAHATGDGKHLQGVFHPELKLFFARDGQVTTRPGPEYIAGFRGTPAPDEAARKRWIESVDITGTAASVKVILDYPRTRFTDYFQLVKAGGSWHIVSKTFHAEQKTPAP